VELQPDFDVRRVLCHVYHVYDMVLDVKNPLPPRLMLPVVPKDSDLPKKED
jgi:hypothetical protein